MVDSQLLIIPLVFFSISTVLPDFKIRELLLHVIKILIKLAPLSRLISQFYNPFTVQLVFINQVPYNTSSIQLPAFSLNSTASLLTAAEKCFSRIAD